MFVGLSCVIIDVKYELVMIIEGRTFNRPRQSWFIPKSCLNALKQSIYVLFIGLLAQRFDRLCPKNYFFVKRYVAYFDNLFPMLVCRLNT